MTRSSPPTISSRLRAYQAGLVQAEHTHDSPHVSLLLKGELIERVGDYEQRIGAGMCALRPRGFKHAVKYAGSGAFIVSMPIETEQLRTLDREAFEHWRKPPTVLVRSMLAMALCGGPAEALDEGLWDAVSGSSRSPATPPAAWLIRARDRLVEESDSISEVCAQAGVHRVHFSRIFLRAFGVPPSIYRRHVRGIRAAGAAISGERAVDAAFRIGFADQSHMIRVVRETTGSSYGRLNLLRNRVTSVQD